jgi:antitoxin component YwqK of YwqJK toxin-antitoxin module
MKKALLFALALIATGCADTIPRNLDDLLMQGPQYLDPETLEPYSGPAFRMSEDDPTELVLRVNLRDGRFHGDFEDFNPERFMNSLTGSEEGCYECGFFRGRGTYENGLEEGPYESYHANGQLSSKSTYTAGEYDGPYESYYENGQLNEKSTYENGERHGPFEFYLENGQLQIKATWNMGEPCGEWISPAPQTYDPCPPGLEDGN